MEIARLWFDFKGRMNRGKYWFVIVANLLVIVAAIVIAVQLRSWPIGILAGLIWLILIVSSFAVGTKRLHDRNKSAWWLLVFYVLPSVIQGIGEHTRELKLPFLLVGVAISIWGFVELGCLRGTIGANNYGPDPLPADA